VNRTITTLVPTAVAMMSSTSTAEGKVTSVVVLTVGAPLQIVMPPDPPAFIVVVPPVMPVTKWILRSRIRPAIVSFAAVNW